MDHEAITEKLRSLASDQANRSKTAVLREFLGEIEAARQKGVRHALIWKTLNELGLQMTEATYFGTLRRLRLRQASAPRASAATAPAAATAPTALAQSPPSTRQDDSHSPAALNNILNSTPDLDALAKAGNPPRRKR